MNRLRSEWLALVVVLGLSLFLRLHALDLFVSGDETKWICRGISFHAALARGDLKGTYQSEHPGVVTMWISTLAVPLHKAGEWVDLCAQTGGTGSKLTRVQNHATLARLPSLIFQARWLLAMVTWLAIVGMWWLSRRLFDGRTALLGAILIGLDPFYLALSRVLHLDALLGSFMSLSVLSLLVHLKGGHQRCYLALSAATGGLAMANKSPGLFLGPWIGVLLLASAWLDPVGQRRERMWEALKIAVLWGVTALGVVVLLWPTLWVDPLSTLGHVLSQALIYAKEPQGDSNFFWGQICADPGPGFYPVAWAFRTTPWVMLGLLLLTLPTWRSQEKRAVPQSIMLVLGGFVLLYSAFMTLGAKKSDRYLLPVFPFVDLLAAAGWAELLGGRRPMAEACWRRWLCDLLILVLLVAQFAALSPSQPYYFSYYNPLLGGAQTAQRVLPIGWGEGMEKAAAYLNGKASAETFHVRTEHIAQFAPFFRGHTSGAHKLDAVHADYYVLYVNTIQRWRVPEVLDWCYGHEKPEKVISAHGIDYVWIYANTLYREALDYIESQASPTTDCLVLDVPAALARHYRGPLPVAALDGSAGEAAIAQALAMATEGRRHVWYITFPETIGDVRGIIHRQLSAQADVHHMQSFSHVEVTRYDLHSHAHFAVPAPTVRCEVRLGDRLRLLGYDLAEPELSGEQPLVVTLYWQATAPLTTSYTVFTHLLGPDDQIWGQGDSIPQKGTWPTTKWLSGDLVVDPYEIPLPPGAPPGAYTLAVGLYDLQTMERLPAVDVGGRRLPEDRILIEHLHLPPNGESGEPHQ